MVLFFISMSLFLQSDGRLYEIKEHRNSLIPSVFISSLVYPETLRCAEQGVGSVQDQNRFNPRFSYS
jgi:hypothetical protein